MNTFMSNLEKDTNFKLTENGAIAHKTTLSAVYDMFALGGAYRSRSDEDCIVLFMKALDENTELAMKCLFYLRDIRGGQGERRFFRICFRWLADKHTNLARKNLANVSEYGRWDDLIYTTLGTKLEKDALAVVKSQLALDVQCQTPSLLAKWLPSENSSANVTKRTAHVVREYLELTHKEYRKMLSALRAKINIVETLMSQNRWDEIQFDKIPSRAGLIYRNAFARRDIIAKKYEAFVKDEDTKVNAKDLYPYDIVREVTKKLNRWGHQIDLSDVERASLQKSWNNLPDYFAGTEQSMIAVVDTSGSMTWGEGQVTPIDVAISLGLYCAERNKGAFANKYISFASRPQLINTIGVDIVDKVDRIYKTNLVDNTNLEATFKLLKQAAAYSKPEDIPSTVLVISDMEIDQGTECYWREDETQFTKTLMERIREDWELSGLKMPKLVYWNVNARHDTILDLGPYATYVSGASPVTFQMVMTGKTGIDLMLEKLNSKRYENIVA